MQEGPGIAVPGMEAIAIVFLIRGPNPAQDAALKKEEFAALVPNASAPEFFVFS